MRIVLILLYTLFATNFIFAQCMTEAHSNHIEDSWRSCELTTNPNTDRTDSHWVMYDLGHEYYLGTTHVWNYNVTGATEIGFKKVVIDYSLDGDIWLNLGEFDLTQATGLNTYTGDEGPDFGGRRARYILITGLENWGNNDCSGLSDWKFNVSSIPLDVNDIALKADCEASSSTIRINWTVPNEDNTPTYTTLERSLDGKTWKRIATVSSQELTKDGQYEFQDNDYSQFICYYRLRQESAGGRLRFSDVVSSTCTIRKNLVIYPNPATSYTQIQWNSSNKTDNYTIQLINPLGQVVHIHPTNTSTLRLPIPLHLKNGTYFVQILGDQNELLATDKLLIVK